MATLRVDVLYCLAHFVVGVREGWGGVGAWLFQEIGCIVVIADVKDE